jgi:hypothetical protein
MAHFVQITDGVVTDGMVINNAVVGDEFPVSELVGQEFIRNHKYFGTWLQTSYNGNFRKQYAGVGFTYDVVKDEFIAPQPYASWSLDANNDWVPPVPKPNGWYSWNETNQSWINIDEPSDEFLDS